MDKSPGELKNKIGQDRTRWFATDKGTAHINMFDDYVQLWDEDSKCIGDYDWFYLAAAIQSMWNVVSLEAVEEKRKRDLEAQKEETEELAPAQTETIPEATADAKDIKAEELFLENLSIQINTDVWPEDLSDIPIPSELFIREYLEEEEKTLRDYLECDGLPERMVLRQQLKVAGLRILRNLVRDVLETEEEEITQPELPRLKNNEERKEWLRNYKTWSLRHEDTYTGAKYYEYRFDNGAVLVAEEWKNKGNEYMPDHETVYLHLIGGPEAPMGQYGIRKWETHDRLNRFPDSETAIVEFLKAVQK